MKRYRTIVADPPWDLEWNANVGVRSVTPQGRAHAALTRLSSDGWPASVRELQHALGYASPASAHEALHRLRTLGLAVQHPRNPRGGWKAVGSP